MDTLEGSSEEALLAEALTTQGLVLCRLGRKQEAKPIIERARRIAERCGDRESAGKALLIVIEEMCDQLPDDVKTWFGKITRSTERMRALIIDILNYSRLSAEVPVFRRTDLQTMFTETLEDFEVAIREKHATITAGALPEIDLIPGQFRQVLHNLLSNALKFSRPDTPPVITLRVRHIQDRSFDSPDDPKGKYCRLILTDNGIGFDEKFSDDVFKLFQRLNSKDKFEGTGIGLAITKKIIERHNGLIAAHSTEGKGTQFDIILPLDH